MPDTPAAIWGDSIDLDKPYLGWFNHDDAGYQPVLVYERDGRKKALLLGDEMSLRRAMFVCQVLAAQTGTQLAGELSKSDRFRPLSMGGTP